MQNWAPVILIKMVRINNSDLMTELRDVAKIQVASDIIPNVLSNQVVPVIDVNPKHARKINVVRYVTSASAAYTTPTDKDFFLMGFNMSFSKTVANDGANLTLTGYVDGVVQNIGTLAGITLTAERAEMSQSFPIPIKIDRGTALTFAVGATMATVRGTIFGYLVENINA